MDMGLDKLTASCSRWPPFRRTPSPLQSKHTARAARALKSGDRPNVSRPFIVRSSDLSMELIARFQPVASDLRFIKACIEISYGFYRFGRYALDIAEVLDIFGDLSKCDQKAVVETARNTQNMIRMSVDSFARRDVALARQIPKLDDAVDDSYRQNLRTVLDQKKDIRCALSAGLILRYLERISDHATYIGECVDYIVTGVEPTR